VSGGSERTRAVAWLARLLLPSRLRDEVLDEIAGLRDLLTARGAPPGRLWPASQIVRFALRIRVATALGGPLPGGKADPHPRSRTAGLRLDVRNALRSLLRQPRFTAVAVATLGLGIAATATIFSLVHGVLLAPLPFRDPGSLRAIGIVANGQPGQVYSISPKAFDLLRETNDAFDGMAAVAGESLVLREDGDATLLTGAAVSHESFALLGVTPRFGASFAPEDDYVGREPVIVLRDALWRSRFGAAPDFVGRRQRFEDATRTVVGVAPPGFGFRGNPRYAGMAPADFWIPFAWDRASQTYAGSNYLQVIGRLAPGVTDEAAGARLDAAFIALGDTYRGRDGLGAVPLRDWLVAPARKPLALLAGAVLLVMLIACANVANLMLARSESRRHEMAVRAALGAGARRIAALLVLDGLLVAAAAGIVGVILALVMTRAIATLFAPVLPRVAGIGVSTPVIAFAAGLALLAGLVTGGFATLRDRIADGAIVLRSGARSIGDGGRARAVLVVAETAFAFLLLAGAGLLLRSFHALNRVDLGFDIDDRLAVRLVLPESRYPDAAATSTFYYDLADALAGVPGVLAAGGSDHVPMQGGNANRGVFDPVVGRDTVNAVEMRYVTPGYAEALGMRLERGRWLTTTDRAGAPNVALVSASLARMLFGDRNALGERIALTGFMKPGDAGLAIAGVVADVNEFGPQNDAPHIVYIPHAQEPRNRTGMTLILHTGGDPGALVGRVREVIRAHDPALPIVFASPMRSLFSDAIRERRVLLLLLGAFGVAAVGLGAAGVYSVMAYTVARRRREVGVRIALGARPGRVLGSVCAHALALAALGIVIGAIAAVALRRTMDAFLFGVSSWDPLTFAGGAAALALVALAGSWAPARRAAAVDPIEVLRND
jgi:predicted permease